MSNTRDLAVLKKRRSVFKGQLTMFNKFVDGFPEHADYTMLRNKLTRLETHFQEVLNIQTEIECLDLEGDYTESRAELENEFDQASSRAQGCLRLERIENASTEATGTASPTTVIDNDVKLPQIQLPKFSGEFDEWPGFADQFKTTIHHNVTINDAKKLTYLRSCLSGDAARTIQSLGNTASNYAVAWTLLERKYDQPAIVANQHIEALLHPSAIKPQFDIHRFLSDSEAHYEALNTSGQLTIDNLLVYIIASHFDAETSEKWKEAKKGDFATVQTIFNFLRDRCKIVPPVCIDQSSKSAKSNQANQRHSTNTRQRTTSQSQKHVFATRTSPHCAICKEAHYTSTCEKLAKLNARERLALVKQNKLCTNCLRSGHALADCQASKCKKCGKPHHTLLHFETNTTQSSEEPRDLEDTSPRTFITCLNVTLPTEILLPTAIIDVCDVNGHTIPCRFLLDSCSQTHFLTERVANKLALPRKTIDTNVTVINNLKSPVNEIVGARIQSANNQFAEQLTFLIVPIVSDKLPSRSLNKHTLGVPKNVKLADPNFHKPGSIDGLIGAEIVCKLMSIGQITLKNNYTYLQKTVFGWIASGSPTRSLPSPRSRCFATTVDPLEKHIERFWEIEEGPNTRILSHEESLCEEHYATTTTRDASTGRYVVSLPFRSPEPYFDDSYDIALNRFHSLERSLARNPALKLQYIEFMREYQRLNHMTELIASDSKQGYFLPHHPVQKASSLTTKLRVVFDASAKAGNGISLNDTLLTGPTIQDDVFTLITRFRKHTFVLTADITKMYRQIIVRPQDRKYQKIIWRETESSPIKTYELNTVTYGITSAPFLATRTLSQLATDEGESHPVASRTLQTDLYVDDLLTGSSSFDKTRTLRDELILLTEKGGFHLRQWASNDPALIADLSQRSDDTHLCLDIDKTTKTLGVFWNARADSIEYAIQKESISHTVTKRSILSHMAQLYDPIGLVGPVIVRAKILMQYLWQLKLNWDESVPTNIHTKWMEHAHQMPRLATLQIPRKIIIADPVSVELHGFCDASERAYGACIYLRSCNKANEIYVQLVCAKSRVAPLKRISLPRLELCAAALLTKLFVSLKHALKINFDQTHFWSDSAIALQWILTPAHELKTFVSNRVSDIQRHTSPKHWRHVPSPENPADLISRGLSPIEFLTHHAFWLNGPIWLKQSSIHWPVTNILLKDVPEKREITCLAVVTDNFGLLQRFSSLYKLKYVVAYCLRFINKCQRKPSNSNSTVSIAELRAALTRILLLTQREGFPREWQQLTRFDSSAKSCKRPLSNLAPFVDGNNIIRVGGRLAHADLPYRHKHPILLPARHHITTLIIRETHIINYHAGAQATLCAVRQNYWPVHGRMTTKRVISKCMKCRRARPTTIDYNMADLPFNRVHFQRPFLVSGIDYCGPFFVKERRHRNIAKVKVYVAIFVCFATKAVHLELVENLTSEAFLAALRRFFSRRGKSTDLYTDNASTFVGAQREIKDMYATLNSADHQRVIETHFKTQDIHWHNIPPRSPHFGGLWEAAVKSFKQHFYRVVGEAVLSYEALQTCVIEIEAILNSRPLVPLSSDPNDLTALTPGHFLIGDAITCMPEHDLTTLKTSRLSMWQHSQQLRQHFWTRWHKDYLHELTVRKKWHDSALAEIGVGTLVTVREDNAPPMRGSLGRIVQVHTGPDGVIRVATVKTAAGEFKRSVKRLSPLPLDNDIDS